MVKRKADALAAPAAKKRKGSIPVDGSVPGAKAYSVEGDFNAKMNQTDVAGNHNKYYFVQLIQKGGKFFVWTRWGRVGDDKSNQTKLDGPQKNQAAAEKNFQSKFRAKTKNDWAKRASFVPKKGKYTLIDVDESKAAKVVVKAASKAAAKGGGKTAFSKDLSEVLRVIFSEDMFKKEMKNKKVDVAKLPLGKLSKGQIGKGNTILGKLKVELGKKKANVVSLSKLSSEFYTIIPHNFGWKKPTPIGDMDEWAEKVDLLNTLNDIEVAQGLKGAGADPMGDSYKKLDNKMALVPSTAKEFKVIKKYFDCTKRRGGAKLLKVFSLERKGERERMKKFAKIKDRRLLWHGTSPAVVAAILHGGLRIMPHSGGRVGKGIYLASENSKSAGYTGSTKIGGTQSSFMFLAEAALGKAHPVFQNAPSLKAAPKKCDSVKAEGVTECFDPKTDGSIPGPHGSVAVPQAKPKKTAHTKSCFSQSEYLVYKEAQAMLRYCCIVKL